MVVFMKMKKQIKQMLALLLAIVLTTSCVRLEAVAAESIMPEGTKEQAEMLEAEAQPETAKAEEENRGMIEETKEDDDNNNASQAIESDLTETTELEFQEETQPEIVETEYKSESHTEALV